MVPIKWRYQNGHRESGHSWRICILFTCMGWTRACPPYPREKFLRCKPFKAFEMEQKMPRGTWKVPRLLWGADDEETLETILTGDFPHAVFFNDFTHVASGLMLACHAPGIAEPNRKCKTCRRIMKRHGEGAAVKRVKRLQEKDLEASPEASTTLDCLDKHRANMNYGWRRRNESPIGTTTWKRRPACCRVTLQTCRNALAQGERRLRPRHPRTFPLRPQPCRILPKMQQNKITPLPVI